MIFTMAWSIRIDASLNTCCKLKFMFLDKHLLNTLSYVSKFSFRVDSCSFLNSWTGFISNWNFPDSVYFFGARAKQVSYWRDNSCRVRTHQKNSGDGVYRLGTIIQSILCTQSAWPIGNSLVRVGTQGLFRPLVQTIFAAPFLPTRVTASCSPKMPCLAIWRV